MRRCHESLTWVEAKTANRRGREQYGKMVLVTTAELDLARRVAEALGLATVELRSAPSGASNRAYVVVDPSMPDAAPVAFLRCDRGDGAVTSSRYGLLREAAILRVAADLGFPVAPVLATFDDPQSLLMRVVPGTSRPNADETECVGAEYMRLIAAVHRADASHFPVEPAATMREAVAEDLAWWSTLARTHGLDDVWLIALAGRVLEARRPHDSTPPSLVHGDVGAGNFMTDGQHITAMLDWELAHLGDPHEDLAWLWMRGAHSDFGDPLTRLHEYEVAAASPIDRARLQWHLVFVMWKTAIATHARLRQPDLVDGSFVQIVVALTYDALLGSELVKLLGGSLPLLTQTPRSTFTPELTVLDEWLGRDSLTRIEELTVGYLRASAAHSTWERDQLERESRDTLGVAPDTLTSLIGRASSDRFAPLALVVARDADRRSQRLPNAVRRIERAQRVGLGTGATA